MACPQNRHKSGSVWVLGCEPPRTNHGLRSKETWVDRLMTGLTSRIHKMQWLSAFFTRLKFLPAFSTRLRFYKVLLLQYSNFYRNIRFCVDMGANARKNALCTYGMNYVHLGKNVASKFCWKLACERFRMVHSVRFGPPVWMASQNEKASDFRHATKLRSNCIFRTSFSTAKTRQICTGAPRNNSSGLWYCMTQDKNEPGLVRYAHLGSENRNAEPLSQLITSKWGSAATSLN